jgi:2-polyprenyl-3-methyl-5-hydroxy-6-metoxy-1,4-benzoquinol methylase
MSINDQLLQEKVVSMYERHPFPSVADPFRKVAEEMELRLKLLGLGPGDYHGKAILDAGCGTGEYTCWYAARDNQVTGVDLSSPSIEKAKNYTESYRLKNVRFERMSVLDLQFPNDSFDLSYSMGVLHHTPDPLKGFSEMVRVTRPGGIIIVSVYNKFGRLRHNLKQKWINILAGDDLNRRVSYAKQWFPRTCEKLKRRMRSDSDTILYDAFGIPHESQHTIGEVLGWFDRAGLSYMGAFGPVTVRDTFFALQQAEYKRFQESLEAFPLAFYAGKLLKTFAQGARHDSPSDGYVFKRPSWFSRGIIQLGWFILGFRFSIFSLAGRKAEGKAGLSGRRLN